MNRDQLKSDLTGRLLAADSPLDPPVQVLTPDNVAWDIIEVVHQPPIDPDDPNDFGVIWLKVQEVL